MRDSPDENHAEITRYPISYGLQAKGNTHPTKSAYLLSMVFGLGGLLLLGFEVAKSKDHA